MSKTSDHKSRAELLARQFNMQLKTEGLGAKARKDRKSLGHEARTEAAERRQLIEMRRRQGYATVEAQEPFTPEVRLIPSKDRSEIAETNGNNTAPVRRPSFKEMRAQTTEFPAIPAEVREVERRKREQRRTTARARQRTERDSRKK